MQQDLVPEGIKNSLIRWVARLLAPGSFMWFEGPKCRFSAIFKNGVKRKGGNYLGGLRSTLNMIVLMMMMMMARLTTMLII